MVKISVITATYNSEKFIERCLSSVAKQKSLKNIEHIIVDGRSTDRTLSIVSGFSHINKIVSENDRGIYHAFNKGVSLATGDVIYFLNSDDYFFDSSVICDVVKIFEADNSLDFCAAKVMAVNYETQEEYLIPYGDNNQLLQKKPCHQGFFCSRDVFNDFGGFNECFIVSADKYFMKQVMAKRKGFYSGRVIAYYQLGGFSSSDIKRFRLEEYLVENLLQENQIPISDYYESLTSKLASFSNLRELFFKFLRNEVFVNNLMQKRVAVFGAHELSIIFYEILLSLDIQVLGMFVTDFEYLTLDYKQLGYQVFLLKDMKENKPDIIFNCVEGKRFEDMQSLLESEFVNATVLDWKDF